MQSEDVYDFKTDVWVFGDVEGYRLLSRCLRRACKSRRVANVHDFVSGTAVSMLCAITPVDRDVKDARLKIAERLVFIRRRPRMEVIIHGSEAAYQKLADIIDEVCRDYTDIPQEHIHMDDWTDDWVIPRSISLNIRGPLSRWSKKGLQEYADFVYQPSEFTLPEEYDFDVIPYTKPSVRQRALRLH